MLADRESALQSSYLPIQKGLENELSVVKRYQVLTLETVKGASAFVRGAGRHGQFGSGGGGAAAAATSVGSGSGGRKYDCVTFDLGGVVIDSPIVMIMEHERELGLPPHTLNRLMQYSKAFSDLETGNCNLVQFCERFTAECVASGRLTSPPDALSKLNIRGLFERMERALTVRPHFIAAIQALKRAGYTVCALTNNWRWDWSPKATASSVGSSGGDKSTVAQSTAQYWRSVDQFYAQFDLVCVYVA